ncbi:hypothetical protein LEP1GSC008_4437 [Leptospira kirschneri serovar Bulgarica str. Nikolaevo]|uniref:Uncharacterized protein n=1 Tax=Leptospira kirschneri serovar Bulgarica str. Nikolaevo TaxID=1240687 RepID=M6FFB3_9LEPT|nr:hypothetical protein LEP1GSC008_4437 [Leptospira kirschneri serovar Bulgarica str. Nikolaevo]
MVELKQNALYHNQPHKLNRILESKLNSAKRFSQTQCIAP